MRSKCMRCNHRPYVHLLLLRALPAGASTPGGLDTPESVASAAPPALFTVLEQKDNKVGGATFGSSHTYTVPSGKAAKPVSQGVNLALDPAELEKLDEATLKARYDEQRKAESAASMPEDVSDILEEQERKRRKKEASKDGKKQGNFKF